jgi:hypothetical protein
VLQVPPISRYGKVIETAEKFGGAAKLVEAGQHRQVLL